MQTARECAIQKMREAECAVWHRNTSCFTERGSIKQVRYRHNPTAASQNPKNT